MIWFFEREGTRLACEFRSRVDGPGYELEWTDLSGHVRIERSDDVDQLTQRLEEIQKLLQRDGWKRSPV